MSRIVMSKTPTELNPGLMEPGMHVGITRSLFVASGLHVLRVHVEHLKFSLKYIGSPKSQH